MGKTCVRDLPEEVAEHKRLIENSVEAIVQRVVRKHARALDNLVDC